MIKTILQIDGMACGMCESHINDTVRKNFAVRKVSSSHKRGVTEILSEQPLDEEKLRQAIGGTGYTVRSVETQEYVKKGLFGKKK
ncbi:MAG: heavy-metal-associated domain-containing protein [Lachnospiraceae bacterium]|nr:heavy-metal-associated domain-containing protein [Lachnospiraceae bacterium]